MPLDLNDSAFVDSLALTNMKAILDAALLNQQSHQKRLDILAEKALARSLENMDSTSVPEGLGLSAAAAANVAQRATDLGSVVAALQQIMKGAQTTPPPTSG